MQLIFLNVKNNLIANKTFFYIYQRNPRLFGIVIDDTFKNAANFEIKILEVKIKDIQKACNAAKKANSSKQPIMKKVSGNYPTEIVTNTPSLTVLKNTVSVK